MRAVVQRVSSARVEVEGRITGQIGRGLLVLLGVGHGDGEAEADWLADKVVNLRLFADDQDKMNRSVLDVGGGILAVSQFTLFGDCRRGRRPSYSEAAPPEKAQDLYAKFVRRLEAHPLVVQQGVFQAHMEVHLVNDGPVTLLLETPSR